MHNITDTDQVFSVREPMWHQLGVILNDYPTRVEAQQLAHPWEPVETGIYRAVPGFAADGQPEVTYEVIPGSKGIERSDTGANLGVVNSTLGLVTNTEMWDVAEAIGTADGQVKIETAGSLEGGAKVWILLRFQEPLQIVGDPNGTTVPYFALQNAHNGSGSFRGQALNTRIVCDNTSRAADAEAKGSGYEFTFRHTARVSQRVEEAKQTVALWRDGVTMWQTAMEHLLTIRITPAQLDRFITEFHPTPPQQQVSERVLRNVDKARSELRSILDGPTSADVRLTAYGLAQAGLEWSQHYRATKGSTSQARMESHFKRAMLSTDRLGSSVIKLAQEVALA